MVQFSRGYMGQFGEPGSAPRPAAAPSRRARGAQGNCSSARCATRYGPAGWPRARMLPPSRSLAADLGLARNTVAEAYADLVAEGWLASRQGAGTWVVNTRDIRSPSRPRGTPGQPDPQSAARIPRRLGLPAHRLARIDPPRLDRRAHRGPADRRPARPTRTARGAHRIPRPRPRRAHVARCRRHLRGHPQRRRAACPGVRQARADRGGSVRAVHLSRRHRGDGRGDRRRSASTNTAPVSTNSTHTDAAAALLTPAHFFPHGVPLHPTRRNAVVDWARRTGRYVLEDDYDGEFRYDRQPIGAVQGLDPAAGVLPRVGEQEPVARAATGLDGAARRPRRPRDRRRGRTTVLRQLHRPADDGRLHLNGPVRQAHSSHAQQLPPQARRIGAAPSARSTSGSAGCPRACTCCYCCPTAPSTRCCAARARRASRCLGSPGCAIPSPGPDVADADGIVVNFGAPAEHAFGAAVDALCEVLAGLK